MERILPKLSICVTAAIITICFAACGQWKPKPVSNATGVTQSKESEIRSQLQGRWKVEEVWASLGDEPVLVNDIGGELVFEFRGDELMTLQDGEETDDWLGYSIDSSQSPIWIDTHRWKGVIRIEDDGILTISLGTFGRPSGFDFSDHTMAERYTLSRVVP